MLLLGKRQPGFRQNTNPITSGIPGGDGGILPMQVGSHLRRLGFTGNPDWDLALHPAIQVELAGSRLSQLGPKVIPTGILATTRYSIWEKWDAI